MGCDKKKNPTMGTNNTITEERRAELLAIRDQLRRDALEKCREAGLVVVTQASDIKIHVVADRIEWDYVDGKLTYKIDGMDISDMVQGFKTAVKVGDFPKDNLILKSKPVLIPREVKD